MNTLSTPKIIVPVLLAITLVLFVSCTAIFLGSHTGPFATIEHTVPQDGLFFFN